MAQTPRATNTSSTPTATISPPSPIPEPISLYRGNAQRTGLVNVPGVPNLAGVAWQKQIGEAGFSSPVYVDGVIYLGTNRGDLLALDAESGDELWTYTEVGGNAGPAAVAGNVVYMGLGVTAGNMGLYALDRHTGKELWNFQTSSPIWLTAPLLYDGKVYFGDQNGVFYAVDIGTHREVWRLDTGRSIYWNAAADDGLVYFTGMGMMYAVDARTGKERWHSRSSVDWSPLTIASGVIYAGALDNGFAAINAQTGDELWSFRDVMTDRANWSAPAVADGVVFAGNRTGYMYAFDARTGAQRWKFKADAPPTSDPLIADGVLYFGVGSHGNTHAEQDQRDVYALNAQTGAALWRFKAQGEVFNGPGLSEHKVYFLTAAGILYALQ
jgi:outer membrane protein assembly factor BamB